MGLHYRGTEEEDGSIRTGPKRQIYVEGYIQSGPGIIRSCNPCTGRVIAADSKHISQVSAQKSAVQEIPK